MSLYSAPSAAPGPSPVRRILAVLEDLAATGGALPRPCGDTADAAELALGPFAAHSSLAAADIRVLEAGTVYRVHLEVDADNGCFDHVLFATRACAPSWIHVLDSYIDERPVSCTRRPWGWLKEVLDLVHLQEDPVALSAAWQRLFACSAAAGTFTGPVRSVTCHVVTSFPFGCRVRARLQGRRLAVTTPAAGESPN